MEREQKAIAMGVAGGALVAVCAFSLGAWVLLTRGHHAQGDIQAAVEYEPTSVWIEEGLDPEVTTFGFEGNTGAAAPSGPELAETEIQRHMNQKQADLMGCYASALQEDDDLQGKVDLQFGIAPDGHVAMVKVTRSTLRSRPTEDCMVSQAQQWSFPQTNRATLMKFDTDFTFVYE